MYRDILFACFPFLAAIVVSLFVLMVLVRLSGCRLRLGHLRRLHGDEIGGVQSLSFVLTLPLFIMILMFIVQLSQITIAKVVVEHAAYAAARSAIVWIPANLPDDEGFDERENRIGPYLRFGRTETGDTGTTYSVYEVEPSGRKFQKIHLAAAMACMSVCPSRDVGSRKDDNVGDAAGALNKAYYAMAPSSVTNPRVPARLENKLAYAVENTRIKIEIHHKEEEPPLQVAHLVPPYLDEFAMNEIGWQDQVVVSVQHDFALLPGPARILARLAEARPGTTPEESYSNGSDEKDSVARRIGRDDSVSVYRLTAKARLGNEGEKSVLPYVQPWNGIPGYSPPPFVEGDPYNYDESTGGDGNESREDFFDRDEETYWRKQDEQGVTTEDSSRNRIQPPDSSSRPD